MGYRAAQPNFSKGAISPAAEARFDIPVYNAAVRRALNVQVQRTGGLRKRQGTRFVAEALSASASLIPFQFSDDQAYVLQFAQAKMRPFALGGAVLETGLKVTAITKAANAQVTAAFHGYSVGDPVYFNTILGMVQINDRFLTVVAVVNANNFTVNIDSTNFDTFTGDTGGQINGTPPAAPRPPPSVPSPTPTPTPPPTTTGGTGSYTHESPNGTGWSGGFYYYSGTHYS